MRVKVKICGIRKVEVAKTAVKAGADFLGFNFVSTSPRYINPSSVKAILKGLPRQVVKVGVFVNEDPDKVRDLVKYLQLDYIQLHGSESVEYCRKLWPIKIIKAFPLAEDFAPCQVLSRLVGYPVDFYLLDRYRQGEGEILNPSKVGMIAQAIPIFLAGGLKPETIAQVVKKVKPYAVDVAQGIETKRRIDTEKLVSFIYNAKQVL